MPYYPEETVDEISLANVIKSASYDAVTGVVGKLALSCLHATAITAAAGPVGTVAMACGVGGAILCLPYACIRTCLDALEPTNSLSIEYLAYEASIFLLNTTTAFYAGAIGAAVLGAAPAPIALCALAGAILLNGLTLIDLMIRIPIVITVGLYSLITTPVIELLGDVLGAMGSVLQMVTPSCMISQRDGQSPNVIPSAPPLLYVEPGLSHQNKQAGPDFQISPLLLRSMHAFSVQWSYSEDTPPAYIDVPVAEAHRIY